MPEYEATFTRHQLIEAMKLYNKKALENPKNFENINDSQECAEQQIDFLLNLTIP